MGKKEFYLFLERLVKRHPYLTHKVQQFLDMTQRKEPVLTDEELQTMWEQFLEQHSFMADVVRMEQKGKRSPAPIREEIPKAAEGSPKKCQTPAELCGDAASTGKIFRVHKPFSESLRQRIKLSQHTDHLRNWSNALKNLPEYTLPLPKVDGDFIRRAKEIWNESIYGNEAVLETVLRHSIEYSRTGKTMPILLVGDPGAGKTLVARNYSKILGLPGSFLSAPSASSGRGLSGAPNLYTGAGVGAIVQAMIDHKAGNPVICIDEIEKASRLNDKGPEFQDQLLSALDESNASWFDNYLEIEVDASHIPFVFTANEKDMISSPLLDRMEVVHMDPPDKEMLHQITRRFTLPKALKAYEAERVVFDEHKREMLVELLWEGGSRSCRAYQKAIEMMVSRAYLTAIETDCTVNITELDVRNAVEHCSRGLKSKPIGFSA